MRRRTSGPRVLIIVQNLPVPLDRRVWLEAQALRDAGYGVSVICPRGPQDERFEELDGVRIHRYRAAPATSGVASFLYEFLYSWFATAAIAVRVYLHDGFDAVQACNPPDTFWALALLFRPLGTRFVFDQHDLCPEVYEARFARPSRVLLGGLRLLERASYATAHAVVSTNEFYRDIALARGRLPAGRVTVVRNGPPADRFVRARPVPELRRGRASLACYLGVMGPQDGVDMIVRAAAVCVHDRGRHDVHFGLLGFGDSLPDLQRLAKELDVEDWVEFVGRSDDAMIRDWLSTADVGLVPDPRTPFNDVSSMNKTVEYMAFGLPLVAFDLRETVATAGEAGHIVHEPTAPAFADALLELLDDTERRERMGAAGRAKFERELAWSHQASAYVGVFDQLLRP